MLLLLLIRQVELSSRFGLGTRRAARDEIVLEFAQSGLHDQVAVLELVHAAVTGSCWTHVDEFVADKRPRQTCAKS